MDGQYRLLTVKNNGIQESIPLWEVLITTDVSTFAFTVSVPYSESVYKNLSEYSPSFTALAGLGVASQEVRKTVTII